MRETYEDAFKKEKHVSSDSEQELGKGLRKKVKPKKYSDNDDELPVLIEMSEPQNDTLTSNLVGKYILEEQNEVINRHLLVIKTKLPCHPRVHAV